MLIAKNEVLIKSQFIQIVKGKDKAIIWHSLFGNPKIVSKETLDFLDLFPNHTNSALSLRNIISKKMLKSLSKT